ncbi:zinc ABC transporter substrate-binding protein ZnuA [Vibrio sp. SM6]|uniref:High-affinity zinc uptake system protein ZnuA n=1 Tax=Vibrio agarilyticus TaxID=2726741 RepID=A0A7X8TMN8_9VIBR|nr:zinc ABC transporter substrate-binding protein ZnuA [Vibrio agarilyticus]NLS11570.1 zinc ABC transporter substrate-binding protein ZnuA [Vibrio agarilyticus]
MNKLMIVMLAALMPWQAQAMNVVTSIKPIQMITFALTDGVTEPMSVLPSNASPHDYALKPSDVKAVQNADLVIWFGPELEGFMGKLLEDHSAVVTLSNESRLHLNAFSDVHTDHDGHNHGSTDPHFWLGVSQAEQAAQIIVEALIKHDPKNKTVYERNLKWFLAQLKQTDEKISQQLMPVRDQGYYVFHDAYGYFEKRYQLNNLGYFTVNPERKPGAKTLISIRKTLAKVPGTCVFAEPQFTPALVERVVQGSAAKIGQLDPIGSDIVLGKTSYFEFLQRMSDDLTACLYPSDLKMLDSEPAH